MTVAQRDGSNFLVLNTKSSWEAGLPVSVQISDAGITLPLHAAYATEGTLERNELPRGMDVADFAVGQCHIIYILDATSHQLWTYDPNQMRFEQINCIDALFTQPIAIAFHPGTLYVGDRESEQRLVALAEVNWQIRWTVSATHDARGHELGLAQPFVPIDLAVDNNGHVYALDHDNLAVVKFDIDGRVITVFDRVPLSIESPVAIAFSPDGHIYVLDQQTRRVLQFSTDGQLVNDAFITLPSSGMHPSGLAIDRRRQIFIGDGRPESSGDEDDRFIHVFTPMGEPDGVVAAYRGAVNTLAVDATERIYIFNQVEQQIVILRLEQTFMPPQGTLHPVGYYFSNALDSTARGTQWHKLVLETDLPANTQVQVSYLIADDIHAFPADAATLPLETLNGLSWSAPLVNPRDALVRCAAGRYLWLRIQLIGQVALAPTVKSIQVYFPRNSYLRYLPAVYQEDTQSRDFLERFLSLFETLFIGLERRIDHIVRYFDASATDVIVGDFLRWLASWLAITVEENWSEEQQRALVQRAPDLYTKRGTRASIEAIVELFIGVKPFIVEHFQLQCAQDPEVQHLLVQLYGDDPYCFCVLLPSSQGTRHPAQTRQLVTRLIEAEKPAHTCAGLLELQPWIYLDMHTYLDINTYLSEPDPRLDMGSVMPRDMLLTDRTPEAGQLERRARLGVDTVLT